MKIYEDFQNECWVFQFSDDGPKLTGPTYEYVARAAIRELAEFLEIDKLVVPSSLTAAEAIQELNAQWRRRRKVRQ